MGGRGGIQQKMMDDFDKGGVDRLRAEIYFFSHEFGWKYKVFVQESENWAKLNTKEVT